MLIYDDFVFIHMPKTAGLFLEEALATEYAPPTETLSQHTGWDEMPPAAAGRPALMYVRNPWDWYVSWYHFMTKVNLPSKSNAEIRQNQWLRLLLGEDLRVTHDGLRGAHDFATLVRSACENLTPSHPVMAEMLARGEPRAARVAHGDDFYTVTIKYLAGAGHGSDLLTIGRYESLLDDLERFFVRNEIPIEDDLLPRIRARQPSNTSPRAPYRDYYDDDLRDLVGRSCRELIETFGYSF